MSTLFRKLWSIGRNGTDEPVRDAWLEDALGALDPVADASRYWFEFHRVVMLVAAPELARRRRRAEVTVSDVVFSWSRTLVPAAMIAAATALFLVQRPDTAAGPLPLRLEEILREGLELSSADPVAEMEITLAAEVY